MDECEKNVIASTQIKNKRLTRMISRVKRNKNSKKLGLTIHIGVLEGYLLDT